MFPIGRCIRLDKTAAKNLTAQDIRYIFDSPGCGDGSETYTVREWLQDFNLPLEDEFYVEWTRCLMGLSSMFSKLVKVPKLDMSLLWQGTMVMLYLLYDTQQDFMPQFQAHAEGITKMIEEFMEDVENGR